MSEVDPGRWTHKTAPPNGSHRRPLWTFPFEISRKYGNSLPFPYRFNVRLEIFQFLFSCLANLFMSWACPSPTTGLPSSSVFFRHVVAPSGRHRSPRLAPGSSRLFSGHLRFLSDSARHLGSPRLSSAPRASSPVTSIFRRTLPDTSALLGSPRLLAPLLRSPRFSVGLGPTPRLSSGFLGFPRVSSGLLV